MSSYETIFARYKKVVEAAFSPKSREAWFNWLNHTALTAVICAVAWKYEFITLYVICFFLVIHLYISTLQGMLRIIYSVCGIFVKRNALYQFFVDSFSPAIGVGGLILVLFMVGLIAKTVQI